MNYYTIFCPKNCNKKYSHLNILNQRDFLINLSSAVIMNIR